MDAASSASASSAKWRRGWSGCGSIAATGRLASPVVAAHARLVALALDQPSGNERLLAPDFTEQRAQPAPQPALGMRARLVVAHAAIPSLGRSFASRAISSRASAM
jgi:hypothetical protein